VRRLAVALALCLTVAAPTAAVACPRTSLGDVDDEVMCLECGVPLDVATDSLQAKQERTFIERQIAACRTKDQIKTALAAQYGDRVLAAPKAKGFGLTAYLVPAAAFLAAAALVTVAALRWRRRRPRAAAVAAADGTPPPDPTDAARLEADLRRYEL
jgi:cytochrome c-type biogenesis protein CcmH/NrfF